MKHYAVTVELDTSAMTAQDLRRKLEQTKVPGDLYDFLRELILKIEELEHRGSPDESFIRPEIAE